MRVLFTTFEGGGHVGPLLMTARRLADRGHAVVVASDEANRAQAAAAGLGFEAWTSAPNRPALGSADDPLDEWRARWPPEIVRRLCRSVIAGPSAAYAADTRALIARFRPDLVVTNELLFGVMAAAEAEGVPLAILTANVWCFPTREDVPPFGPGFLPSTASWAARRDRMVRDMTSRWYDAGLADLNRTRAGLGLPPLARLLDQLKAAEQVVLGVASAFDYDRPAPPGFAYAGPLAAAPSWAPDADAAALLDPQRPNVLISFSTTEQGHAPLLQRCVQALAGLPAHGVATLGPALRHVHLPDLPNLSVAEQASHDVLVPRCRLVVSHAGHGTVVRPLAHGVPVLCLPTGRDQPENAARVVAAGAGLRLSPSAPAWRIRRAIRRILDDPGFGARAAELGAAIRRETDEGRRAADLLEALAQRRRMS